MVEAAAQTTPTQIVVVVPQESSTIREVLGSAVRYVEQSRTLGSGHAVLQAHAVLKDADNVVVLSGDVPLIQPHTLKEMIRVHDEREACVTLLTTTRTDHDGRGRVIRTPSGRISAVLEETEADEATLKISEFNSGVYCFRGPWLWDNIGDLGPSRSGEVYLTDLIAMAHRQGMPIESVQPEDPEETLGVNTRVQLAAVEAAMRKRILEQWMLGGVTIPDPSSVYIDAAVELGQDTVILPNTHITQRTRIGRDCEIGPNSVVSQSQIGDGCKIMASVVQGATLNERVQVGPFSHIRPGTHLDKGVRIGNFAEVKDSHIGPRSRSAHFSYIGDADLGANVNIGAGTVTCNFDGEKKNRTVIGDDAFIGSDSMLVAPVEIGARASTGAGAVVTSDVPPDSLAVGVPARVSPKKRRRKTKS